MRLLILVILLLALASAGCVKSDTSAPMNVTNNSSSNMTTMLPKVVLNETHAFSTGAASSTPAGQPTEKTVAVPAGYEKLNLTVTFSPGAGAPAPVPGGGRVPAGVASGIDVKLGALDCALPDGPVQGRVTCTKMGALAPGDLKLTYSGEGDVTARVVVTAS